jgi:protein TonB
MLKGQPTPTPLNRSGPNWLLRGLIILSLGVHFIIFLHISGIYGKKSLNYIELTVEDVQKPRIRSIPRPRLRPKKTFQPNEVKRIKAPPRIIPNFKPQKIAPIEQDFSEGIVENIAPPEIPGSPDLASVQIEKGGIEFETPNTYLEMVRMKIERHKNYPPKAMEQKIEGAVVVGFVINIEGNVINEKVVKSSGHIILDNAAINAIRDAAPFPSPPRHLFSSDVPLKVTIVFELT